MLGLGRGPPAGASDRGVRMPWLLLYGLFPGRGVRMPWLLLNGLLPGRGPPGRGPGVGRGAGLAPSAGLGLGAAGVPAAGEGADGLGADGVGADGVDAVGFGCVVAAAASAVAAAAGAGASGVAGVGAGALAAAGLRTLPGVGRDDGPLLGAAGVAFAGFFSAAGSAAGLDAATASRSFFAAGASILDEALLTNSPSSLSLATASLLSISSSFASS